MSLRVAVLSFHILGFVGLAVSVSGEWPVTPDFRRTTYFAGSTGFSPARSNEWRSPGYSMRSSYAILVQSSTSGGSNP